MNHSKRRVGRLSAGLLTLAALVIVPTGCGTLKHLLEEASEPLTIRVLTYNVRHGEGMDGRLDLERVARVIRSVRPDIVALQEIDLNVARTERVDQAARLADLTDMESVFGAFMDYQGGEYGMAVLSRWPIVEYTNYELPRGAEPRSTLAVRIRLPGGEGEIILAGIHFYRTEGQRFRQAREVVDIFEHEPTPVILAGDFNSRPGDRVMDVVDHHWLFPRKDGRAYTFPSDEPEREIDFIAYRPEDRFEVVEYRVIDERRASDHKPVLLVLRVR